MTTVDARPRNPLRTLYFSRAAFAVAWAVLLVVSTMTAGAIGTLSAVLLVAYPVVDLVAALIDRSTSSTGGPTVLLVLNGALSLATAIALLVAVSSGVGAVLVVWGAWAITAGAVQLAVGLRRRALGGQWAMILSGGISVLAGLAFVLQSGGTASVVGLAGYATLGGIFFLASALRQRPTR